MPRPNPPIEETAIPQSNKRSIHYTIIISAIPILTSIVTTVAQFYVQLPKIGEIEKTVKALEIEQGKINVKLEGINDVDEDLEKLQEDHLKLKETVDRNLGRFANSNP